MTTKMTTALRSFLGRVVDRLEAVPYSALALPLRPAIALVYWNSAMAKLANWETTLYLFEEEYKVPLLPPGLAAHLATAIELVAAPLIVLGLLTRAAALVLLAMTAVIQVFVYPGSWPTHLQWAAMLLILLCRGPGAISIDHWLRRRFAAVLTGRRNTQ